MQPLRQQQLLLPHVHALLVPVAHALDELLLLALPVPAQHGHEQHAFPLAHDEIALQLQVAQIRGALPVPFGALQQEQRQLRQQQRLLQMHQQQMFLHEEFPESY
jgi:hypothetical protein